MIRTPSTGLTPVLVRYFSYFALPEWDLAQTGRSS